MSNLTPLSKIAIAFVLLLTLAGCPATLPSGPTATNPVPLRNPKISTCECPYDQVVTNGTLTG